MSKHTKGPWAVHSFSDTDFVVVTKNGGRIVCDVDRTKITTNKALRSRVKVDARLIAAAPDLLEALQMLYSETLDYIRLNNLGGEDNQCMRLARAALTKATGEPS